MQPTNSRIVISQSRSSICRRYYTSQTVKPTLGTVGRNAFVVRPLNLIYVNIKTKVFLIERDISHFNGKWSITFAVYVIKESTTIRNSIQSSIKR